MTDAIAVTISAHALKAAASHAGKGHLACVHVVASGGMCHVVATDSYRIYHYSESVSPHASVDVLVPLSTVKALKVVATTEYARISPDRMEIETFARRVGSTYTPIDAHDLKGRTYPTMATINDLFPPDGDLGRGAVPAVNPAYMIDAYRAFDALGMRPQCLHCGEMRPLTIAAPWCRSGRRVYDGSGDSTGVARYADGRCRLRVIVMPVSSDRWYCEETTVGGGRASERVRDLRHDLEVSERGAADARAAMDGAMEALGRAAAREKALKAAVVRMASRGASVDPVATVSTSTRVDVPDVEASGLDLVGTAPASQLYVCWATDGARRVCEVRRYRKPASAAEHGARYAREWLGRGMGDGLVSGVVQGPDVDAVPWSV